MSSRIPEIYRDAGKAILAKHVPQLVEKPAASVTDRKRFQQLLVTPAWNELPLPCRMLGRARLGWDELFEQIRTTVYDAGGPTVKLRPDAAARITEAFKRTVADVAAKMAQAAPAPAKSVDAPSPAAEAPRPPANPDVAIGIDLGTTFSAVAWVDSDGRPVAIENASGDLITPSIVLFEDDGTVVGKEAAHVALMEPERVAECVKRDMGSRQYRKRVNGEYVPPEVVSSIVLRSLKADAERRLGPLSQAVITVPAYFDEPRRQATVNAGRLAGFDVLDILNEPTAAAISYGYQKGYFTGEGDAAAKPIKVLVYDLGGGTFDVTILSIEGQNFTVVATDGDVRLGGKDFDEKLVNIAAERYIEEHREDPRTNPSSLQDLHSSAEQAKRALSERSKATIFINHLGTRMKVDVTRQEFEEATGPLLARTRHTCEVVIRDAGLKWSDIDRVVLVGGSTRMPMVGAMLEGLCPTIPIDRSLSPDLAVAHGAALYADLLLKRKKAGESTPAKFRLANVNSHSLGIVGIDTATGQKVNRILIPKNTPLPHSVTKGFKLAKASQKSVRIEVLEGESRRPEGCTAVGICRIGNLPADLPDGASVDITYEYEQNGRLHVSAKLRGYAAIFRTTFDREGTLDEQDVNTWTEYVAHESRKMTE